MKIIKFGMVGVVNTAVDYALLNALVFLFHVVSPGALVLCNLFSFLGANVNSYILNKRWTFEDRSRWAKKEYALFLLCSLGGLGLNCTVVYFFSSVLSRWGWSIYANVNLAKLFATMVGMVWNYISYRSFVFGGGSGGVRKAGGRAHRGSVLWEKGS